MSNPGRHREHDFIHTSTILGFALASAASDWMPTSNVDSALSHSSILRTVFKPHHAWTNPRIRVLSDTLRGAMDEYKSMIAATNVKPLTDQEWHQAALWALHPQRVTNVLTAVYSNKFHQNLQLLADTAPFPLTVVSHGPEWKGTLDKLLGYWAYLKGVDDDAIIVFVDAFDVFANGFDGHELLRRYFAFNTPIVISTEENVFPREVDIQAHTAVQLLGELGAANVSHGSRFLNAGGIIGVGWAMRRMYNNVVENMVANDPHLLQAHGDRVGHWFLHAYDQYELWRYFIRHVRAVYEQEETELLLTLDTEQRIFGSTVFAKENWMELLSDCQGGVNGKHSIDVDVALVFDAPQRVFEISQCHARFVGRKSPPIFWHGHGPWKPAWEGLRDRMQAVGCLPTAGFKKKNITDQNLFAQTSDK